LRFYRGACTFRSIFEILTKPSILDISAPFAISVLFIKTLHPFDHFMTHTKPQLPTLRNHRVQVSRNPLFFKLIRPVVLPCACKTGICVFGNFRELAINTTKDLLNQTGPLLAARLAPRPPHTPFASQSLRASQANHVFCDHAP
jgi:hypothetical protein